MFVTGRSCENMERQGRYRRGRRHGYGFVFGFVAASISSAGARRCEPKVISNLT